MSNDPLSLEHCEAVLKEITAERDRYKHKVEQLLAFRECFVSHPGEGTLECDVIKPCPFCRADRIKVALEAEYHRKPCGKTCVGGGFAACYGCDDRIRRALGMKLRRSEETGGSGPSP